MNKKILVIGAILLALVGVGSYFASQSIENEVEDYLRAEIAKTPLKVETIEYSASSGTLTLNGVSFETVLNKESAQPIDFALTADSLELKDFNVDILKAETTDFSVFEDLTIQNIAYTMKAKEQVLVESSSSSVNVKEYEQNIYKLLQEYEKSTTSEAFYDAVLTQAHKGITLKDYKVTVPATALPELAMDLSIDEFIIEPYNFMNWDTPNTITAHYKNARALTAEADIQFANITIKELLIPNPSLYTLMMNELANQNMFANIRNLEKQVLNNPKYQDQLKDYVFGETPLFSQFLFEGIVLNIKDKSLEHIKDSAVNIGAISLDLSAGETLSTALALNDFSLSSEFLYTLVDAPYIPLVDAFLGEKLVLDFATSQKMNAQTGNATLKVDANVENLFGTSASIDLVDESDQEPWVKFINLFTSFDRAKYSKFGLTYKDEGLLPLVGQVAVMEVGLPLEILLELAKSEVDKFIAKVTLEANKIAEEKKLIEEGSLEKSNQEIKNEEFLITLVQQGADATLKMLEKPGTLHTEISFTRPLTPDEIGEKLVAPFFYPTVVENVIKDYKIEVEQGDKTFIEATPAQLITK